jgi:hypothetical protein
VGKNNQTVLVAYEDGKIQLETAAKSIGDSLRKLGHDITVRKASEVLIPEILAASMYFLGAGDNKPAGYDEIERVFKGISLHGRRAAFFVSSPDGPAKYLKSIIKPTGLSVKGDPFLVPSSVSGKKSPAKAGGSAVASWAASVLG